MKITFHKTLKLLAAGLCALACMTGRAHASAMLSLFDGTTTINVLDNSPMDTNAAIGVITFSGAIGVWDINVSTGVTKPVSGSASSPEMSLTSVDHSTAAGSLTITFTDTGFTAPAGSVTAAIGGTQNNGTTQFDVYQDLNLLTSSGTLTVNPFAASSVGVLSGSANYSLTAQVTMTHSAPGTTSWNTDLTLVPEGNTVYAVLGLGLIAGLAGLRRRFLAANPTR